MPYFELFFKLIANFPLQSLLFLHITQYVKCIALRSWGATSMCEAKKSLEQKRI